MQRLDSPRGTPTAHVVETRRPRKRPRDASTPEVERPSPKRHGHGTLMNEVADSSGLSSGLERGDEEEVMNMGLSEVSTTTKQRSEPSLAELWGVYARSNAKLRECHFLRLNRSSAGRVVSGQEDECEPTECGSGNETFVGVDDT